MTDNANVKANDGSELIAQFVQESNDDGKVLTGRFRCTNVETSQVTLITVSRPRLGVIRTCVQELVPGAN